MHYVYKYVFKNECIYIGMTDRKLRDRLKEHGKNFDNIPSYAWEELSRSNIYFIELPTHQMADVVESELIRRYKPKYNKAKKGNDWQGLPFIEPEWKQYKTKKEKIKEEERRRIKIDELKSFIKETSEFIEEQNIKIKNDQIKIENLIKQSSEDYIEAMERTRFSERMEMQKYLDKVTGKGCIGLKRTTGKTFEEVIREYKSCNAPIYYVSQCYNKRGDLTCLKRIYTSPPDGEILEFDFYQWGCSQRKGSLYYGRTDKTMKNWDAVRHWENRGDNRYYKLPYDELKKYVKEDK